MKSDFMIALTQLAAERNLPKEVILKTVEAALVSAFKKDSFGEDQEVSVRIAPQSGDVRVYVQKIVVDDVEDSSCEIALADARKIKKDIKIGELIEVESIFSLPNKYDSRLCTLLFAQESYLRFLDRSCPADLQPIP